MFDESLALDVIDITLATLLLDPVTYKAFPPVPRLRVLGCKPQHASVLGVFVPDGPLIVQER